MTNDDEWQERLRAAIEKTIRARQARKAERDAFAERRKHGLAARHAARLTRTQPPTDDTETEQP